MAHKKKGAKKNNSAANGASKQQPLAAQANGDAHSYKEAVTTSLDVNGSGPDVHANGHRTSEGSGPLASPRTETGAGDKVAPKANGTPPQSPVRMQTQPQTGEQAAQDAHKALQETVQHLRGDLRNEKDMREAAEASVMMWKATSAALGLSTLGCAAVALIAISRCRT